MQKYLIINILKTFSADEMKDFEKFIKSPYFGCSNYVISFFNAIKKFHPDFNITDFNKEYIFNRLYPGKKYNDTTMRKLSSELFNMAENFLARKDYDISWERDRKLLAEYRTRRLYPLFEKQWKKIQRKFDNKNIFEYDFLIHRHFSELENINYHSARKREIQNFENHNNFYEYLINYTLNYVMNGAASQYVYRNAYNIDDDKNLLKSFVNNFDFDMFLKSVDDIGYKDKNVLKLNYTMMTMFLEINDHSKYFDYKKNLLKSVKDISIESRYFYLTKLINACKLKIRAGYDEFRDEIFRVYKFMTDNQMLVEPSRKFISEFVFNDIVSYGIESGNANWVKEFIEVNIKNVIPDTREETYIYSKAILEFYHRNHQKSLELFSVIKGDLSHSKFTIRSFILKNYYELCYFDAAKSLLDSLRHFLKSTKHLNEKTRYDYALFLNYYAKLLNIKMDYKKGPTSSLVRNLKKEKFPEKEWLLTKAIELESECRDY